MKLNFKDPMTLIRLIIILIMILFGFNVFRNMSTTGDSTTVMISIMIFFLLINISIFIYIIKNRSTKKLNQKVQESTSSKSNQTNLDYTPSQKSNISFDDVAGFDEIKNEIYEVLDFIKNPQKYRALNVNLPKGILFVGPPGVGKTLIAKAISNEAGIPFIYQSGATLVQQYVGLGAQKVQELFNKARVNSPSIIFIDEIDAIGKDRDKTDSEEREATLNQILTQMDGFENSDGILVIAATNRIDVLDKALLRAGRFDKRVFFHLPTLEDRKKIISSYLKNRPNTIDVELIANKTVGFSGADISTLINEAALEAVKFNLDKIETHNVLSVKDKIKANKQSKIFLDDTTKDIVALDKAAKYLLLQQNKIEFENVSLIEESLDFDTESILSSTQILHYIQYYLIGYYAHLVLLGENYNFSENDLMNAESLIEKVVKNYKMFPDKNKDILMDEIEKFLLDFIEKNRESILRLKDLLLTQEIVTNKELNDLF